MARATRATAEMTRVLILIRVLLPSLPGIEVS
jgi:hypothetical protein